MPIDPATIVWDDSPQLDTISWDEPVSPDIPTLQEGELNQLQPKTRELNLFQKGVNVLGDIASLGGKTAYSEYASPEQIKSEQPLNVLKASAEVPLKLGSDLLNLGVSGYGTALDYIGLTDKEFGVQKPFGERFESSIYNYQPSEKGQEYYKTVMDNMAAIPAMNEFQSLPYLSKYKDIQKNIKDFQKTETAEALAKLKRDIPKSKVLQEVSDEGYKIVPSATSNPSKTQQLMESISGKFKLQEAAKFENQKVTDKLVRRYLNLTDDAVLDADIMKNVRAKYGKVYAEIDKLPEIQTKTPLQNVVTIGGKPVQSFTTKIRSGKTILDDIKTARDDLRDYWTSYKRGGANADRKAAEALELKVESLEDELARLVTEHKKTNLIPKLKEARKEIAKTHLVEKAMNPFTGQVDAVELSRAFGKKYMDKEALKITKFAKNYKDLAKPPKVDAPQPFSIYDLAYIAHEGARGKPSALMPLLRPIYKKTLLKPKTQQSLINRQLNPEVVKNLTTDINPSMRSLLGTQGLTADQINYLLQNQNNGLLGK